MDRPVMGETPPETVGSWLKACRLDEIPPQGARVIKTARFDVAVFRTADGRVFALDDRCPHKGGPLSQGIVFGDQVACPLHGWIIGLESGQARLPDEGCTRRYPVRVVDDQVYLAVSSSMIAEEDVAESPGLTEPNPALGS